VGAHFSARRRPSGRSSIIPALCTLAHHTCAPSGGMFAWGPSPPRPVNRQHAPGARKSWNLRAVARHHRAGAAIADASRPARRISASPVARSVLALWPLHGDSSSVTVRTSGRDSAQPKFWSDRVEQAHRPAMSVMRENDAAILPAPADRGQRVPRLPPDLSVYVELARALTPREFENVLGALPVERVRAYGQKLQPHHALPEVAFILCQFQSFLGPQACSSDDAGMNAMRAYERGDFQQGARIAKRNNAAVLRRLRTLHRRPTLRRRAARRVRSEAARQARARGARAPTADDGPSSSGEEPPPRPAPGALAPGAVERRRSPTREPCAGRARTGPRRPGSARPHGSRAAPCCSRLAWPRRAAAMRVADSRSAGAGPRSGHTRAEGTRPFRAGAGAIGASLARRGGAAGFCSSSSREETSSVTPERVEGAAR
jgi:hypothetical protein